MIERNADGIFGQPRGIGYLIFAEGWFNVSFYGVRVLLVLYMTRQLLLPGHAGGVLWLAPLRRLLEGEYGTLSTVALASAILGLFTSVVFLTPLGGAFIADRWLGRTRSILSGGVLTMIGCLLLIFEPSFVAGLLLLLIGIGLFSGNVVAQLGELYARDDPRRGDGFQLYYLSIDAAVIVAPLICGTLGELWGFGYGFAAAGGAMVLAMGGYIAGRRWLPPEPPRRRDRNLADHPPIGRAGWRAVLVLLLLIPVIGVAAVANNQIYGAYEIWGAANYDLVFFGRHMPVSWLISVDAFISFGSGFLVLGLWRWLETRGRLPSEINRCAIGAFLSAGATLMLAFAGWAAHGGKVGLGWGIAFHTINNIGISMLFPLTLALFSRVAPAGLTATMTNSAKLNFFVSFQIVGWLGGFVDRLDAGTFWLVHAGLVTVGGLMLLAVGWLFRDTLAPAAQPAVD